MVDYKIFRKKERKEKKKEKKEKKRKQQHYKGWKEFKKAVKKGIKNLLMTEKRKIKRRIRKRTSGTYDFSRRFIFDSDSYSLTKIIRLGRAQFKELIDITFHKIFSSFTLEEILRYFRSHLINYTLLFLVLRKYDRRYFLLEQFFFSKYETQLFHRITKKVKKAKDGLIKPGVELEQVIDTIRQIINTLAPDNSHEIRGVLEPCLKLQDSKSTIPHKVIVPAVNTYKPLFMKLFEYYKQLCKKEYRQRDICVGNNKNMETIESFKNTVELLKNLLIQHPDQSYLVALREVYKMLENTGDHVENIASVFRNHQKKMFKKVSDAIFRDEQKLKEYIKFYDDFSQEPAMEFFGIASQLKKDRDELQRQLYTYYGIDLSEVHMFKKQKNWIIYYSELLDLYDEINGGDGEREVIYIDEQKKDIKQIMHYLLKVAQEYKEARKHDYVLKIYMEIAEILNKYKEPYGFERSIQYIEDKILKNYYYVYQ